MADKIKQEGDKHYVDIEATAKDPNAPEDSNERVEGAFQFVVGADLAEDIQKFGEDTVREMWIRGAVIKAQGAVRTELGSGTHPDDIPEQLADWRPDVTHTAKKDPKTSILANWSKMSDEEKAEVLAAIEERS